MCNESHIYVYSFKKESLFYVCRLLIMSVQFMCTFHVLNDLQGVLDYLDNLSVIQIRKLYSMLSMLAFRNPQEGGLIQVNM